MPRRKAPALPTSGELEQAGGAHAAPDAHRHDDVFDVAALAFQQRVHRHPGTAEPIRVSDRDRAAVNVQALVGDAERVPAVDGLHGEGFVELPQANIVDAETVAL